ncbi:hypothetical protein D5278_03540 [bacterium 1XD21-13]|nr:hypothetical protein [bacterium 1XD21-13]
MKKTTIALIIVGLIVILFAIFFPSTIAEVHTPAHRAAWRILIGLLGCFSLIFGICKIVCRK